MKNSTKNSTIVARLGIIAALVFVAYSIDKLISITFPISCAIATIIIVMSIIQFFDYKTAIFTTTVFGVVSFLYAIIVPKFYSIYFVQIQISILPRIMIGVVSYGVYILMKKITVNKSKFVKEYVTSAVAACFGVLTNTVLVITMISLAAVDGDVIALLLKTVIGVFFLIEFACALFVVPIVVNAVKSKLTKFIK